MIPKTFIEYYGDQTRWFLGEVVNVTDDPMKLGRARVRIFGVYDEIEEEDLPWAQIVVPVTQSTYMGNGQNLGLLPGAQVFGMFLDGQNSQLPLIIGAVPKKGDTNEKVKENYPLNKVYETETGHYKEWDDSASGRIREQHRSGTHYEMRENGTLFIHATKDLEITTEGNVTITVNGGQTTIDSEDITMTGNALVEGNLVVNGDTRVDGGISVGDDVNTDKGISHNDHKHKILTGSSKGTTDKPV